MTAAEQLHWGEPDAGCVSCGQPHWTIDDHRCGSCLGLDLVHCPRCLEDISAIVEREVSRRWRDTSNDVNDVWTVGKYLDRITAAVEAVQSRTPEATAIRADNLRQTLQEART